MLVNVLTENKLLKVTFCLKGEHGKAVSGLKVGKCEKIQEIAYRKSLVYEGF